MPSTYRWFSCHVGGSWKSVHESSHSQGNTDFEYIHQNLFIIVESWPCRVPYSYKPMSRFSHGKNGKWYCPFAHMHDSEQPSPGALLLGLAKSLYR